MPADRPAIQPYRIASRPETLRIRRNLLRQFTRRMRQQLNPDWKLNYEI